MYEKHKKEKWLWSFPGIIALLHLYCPAITALAQEVSDQVQFLCLCKISYCAFSESISTAGYRVFWDGAFSIPSGEAGFPPAVIEIFIDPKVGGRKTSGPKFLSTFDKKQGPGWCRAQASLSPIHLSWCDHNHCTGLTSSHTNVMCVCLTFALCPHHLNPNCFGKHVTIKLCLFPLLFLPP